MMSLAGLVVMASTAMGQATETATLPDDVRSMMQYNIGSWSIEGTVSGADIEGTYNCRWAPGRHCYIVRCSATIDGVSDDVQHMSGIAGYDASTKKTVEKNFWSNGSHFTMTLDASGSPGINAIIEGKLTGIQDGQAVEANVKIERKGRQKWVYTSTIEGEPSAEVVFKKQAPAIRGRKGPQGGGRVGRRPIASSPDDAKSGNKAKKKVEKKDDDLPQR
jgi:hypothetical protein